MKRFAFKTLSILLAAVLLVAALPIAAFAEDVSPCNVTPHTHIYEWCYTVYGFQYEPDLGDYHIKNAYSAEGCVLCGLIRSVADKPFDSYLDAHVFDDSVDPEVDMEGDCIYCGATISW